MTTLTLRFINGHFVVIGPDIEPMKFKSRREAKDWCRPGRKITTACNGRSLSPEGFSFRTQGVPTHSLYWAFERPCRNSPAWSAGGTEMDWRAASCPSPASLPRRPKQLVGSDSQQY
jgi:hypothetical protein